MPIHDLVSKGLIDVTAPPADTSSVARETTLAFAFDAGYREQFLTMIYSMASIGTLSHSPIIVYTDDQAVVDDPIIGIVADEIRLIDDARMSVLLDLAENNVRRQYKQNWHRGTFLKWAIFEEHQTENLLFLDVDMTVLKPLEPFLEELPDKDLIYCPQFQNAIVSNEQGERSMVEIAEQLNDLADGQFDGAHRRVNSGVMLARKSILNSDFFDAMTKFASQEVMTNEQSHITNFVRSDYPCRHGLVRAIFNFHESYLRRLSAPLAIELLEKIHVLHHAGGAKPWTLETPAEIPLSAACWWHVRREANQRSGLFN